MSAGNQNKFGLDELEFIPGEFPFKKDSAWNKLQERIGEKKTKKNYWYLAAASIVIVLSAGIFMWNYEKRKDVVKNGSADKGLATKSGSGKITSDFNDNSNSNSKSQSQSNSNSNYNSNSNSNSNSVSGSQSNLPANSKSLPLIINGKKSVIESNPDKRSFTGNKNSLSEKINFSNVKSDKNLLVEEIPKSQSTLNPGTSTLLTESKSPDVLNNIPLETQQNHTAAQLQPVKKKLKVLHHNHLDKTFPVTNPAYSARSGNIQGTTVFGRNKSDDFIKIKITTPN